MKSLATALLLACSLGLAMTAASPSEAQASTRSAHGKKAKSGKAKLPPQNNGSQESSTDRDRRLSRECKGMPNAGACLGYTR